MSLPTRHVQSMGITVWVSESQRIYLKTLPDQPVLITEFDPMMFSVLVDHATVYPEKRIVFTFRDGREV